MCTQAQGHSDSGHVMGKQQSFQQKTLRMLGSQSMGGEESGLVRLGRSGRLKCLSPQTNLPPEKYKLQRNLFVPRQNKSRCFDDSV